MSGTERASGPEGLRVVVFTDTLADVNGVSRFILDALRVCAARGHDLTVVTSTRLALPESVRGDEAAGRIVNLKPRLARAMPGYPNLEIVTPPLRRARALVESLRPDVVHVSTPGPVGFAGRWAAMRTRVPLVGVYHTDFPAYVRHLFDDDALGWCAEEAMRRFYRPFQKVLTRSARAAKDLTRLGFSCRRLMTLRAGTDVEAFHPRHRDDGVWARLGLGGAGTPPVRVLTTTRVSVEKNLPMLARVWPRASVALESQGVAAELIVVGDGPYRVEMERALAGQRVRFTGFRRGAELAALYASSDLFVFPSCTDTLGQVVMEAQASGLPTLVSDAGGPMEMVKPDVTGLVLPGRDESAWVEAIVSRARDGARRRAMGVAAREWMGAHTIERSIEHFWAVHEMVARRAADDMGAMSCGSDAASGLD